MQLGHANIRVRDVERSEKFYTEVLGLHVTHRRGGTVFLSARDHSHELAIRGIGTDALGPADNNQVGTNHFAWEMASFEDLQAMYRHLKARGVQILRTRENTHSVGVYFNDPDGNGLEVYYELPRSEWHRDRPFSGAGDKGRFPGPWDEALRGAAPATARA
jgi:catechol 2,3-dioxygenase